jgi:predicted Zn-dependent protease
VPSQAAQGSDPVQDTLDAAGLLFGGLGLLVGVTVSMAGVYRGMVEDAEALIDGQACDILNIKISKVGGLLAAMRIATLAARSPIEKYPAERLRLLNDLYPDKEPTPGQWLKVVE